MRNIRSERLSLRGLGKIKEGVVVVRNRCKTSEGRGGESMFISIVSREREILASREKYLQTTGNISKA